MSVANQPISSEPTMDEILASIRRMLKEEDEVSATQDDGSSTDEPPIDLDTSMVEDPGAERHEESGQLTTPEVLAAATPSSGVSASFGDTRVNAAPSSNPNSGVEHGSGYGPAPAAEHDHQAEPPNESSRGHKLNQGIQAAEPTVSDKTVRDAGRHLGSLVRSLSNQRTLAVSRGGTSLEDVVRDELRPLLKTWLDNNLPELVERLVHAEIERLIERADR